MGLSGLAQVNVSDWVMFGEVSVPVIRLTSPSAIQGHKQFFDGLGDALKEGRRRITRSLVCAAGHHDCSGPEVLLLVNAELAEFWYSQTPLAPEGRWMR